MDRELKDLDDVDRALEEKPVEGVIERKRAHREYAETSETGAAS